LRVVLDPTRRLGSHYRVFNDDSAETLYVCGRSLTRPTETHFGRARILPAFDASGVLDVTELVRHLRARGCSRTFIEGGGVTVSMCLEASALDRLQVAIAPLIIGNGRPAIRLAPPLALSDCQRPRYRVFRMGGDVLFDCELRGEPAPDGEQAGTRGPSVTRVI
jgi:riboflavin biosynthesis pyrimidine reductase